jgi:BCD family chlorophyll transporter-like MFS transporter
MIPRWLNFHAIRLGAFALGYGVTGALTGGTLNRIMVIEFGLPVALVGLFFGASLLISPLRAWMGYRSDTHPIGGLRREPYVLLGSLLAGAGVILAIVLLIGLSGNLLLLSISVMLAFLLHEFGRNLSHNSFHALLADKFSADARTRAMTLFEIVTLLGLIIGAGSVAGALRQYTPERLVAVTISVAIVTFLLAVIGALRNEPRNQTTDRAVQIASSTPFGKVVAQMVIADPQVRRFFILIVLVVLGTLAQDVLLEPYGGLVLQMSVAETSRLTMFWGVGVIVAMLASSLFLIRYFGQLMVIRVGIIISMVVFAGVITSGWLGNAGLFRWLVFFMGLGTGLAGAGLLSSIIQFTTRIRSGLLLGVWGFAMIAGRSLGSLFGGVIVDIVQLLVNGDPFIAYATVFALEALLLVAALILTTRIGVTDSKAVAEESHLLDYDGAAGAASLS